MQIVCHQYWPTQHDTADVFNHFSVKLISETQESNDIIRRTLGIKDMNVCSFSLYIISIFLVPFRLESVKQLCSLM